MGREIRRVPKGWEHPTYFGELQPLNDEDYETAMRKWKEGLYPVRPELPSFYRPAWKDEERTCYQIYETLSEGTPMSPVFEDVESMVRWLIDTEGCSETAARKFVEAGRVASVMAVKKDGKWEVAAQNIHTLDEDEKQGG